MKAYILLITALMITSALFAGEYGHEYPAHNWEVELFGVDGAIRNNSFSVGFWNTNMATDPYWDSQELTEILDRIPSDGLDAKGRLRATVVGVRYRDWSLSAGMRGDGYASVPKDVAEIALLGSKMDNSYTFSDLTGLSYAAADYRGGYSRALPIKQLPNLRGEIGLHLYQGVFMSRAEDAVGNLLITDELIQGDANFRSVQATSGSGFGFDFGLATPLNDRWQVGLAVDNLYGFINWQIEEATVAELSAHADGIAIDSLDEDNYLDRVFVSESETVDADGSYRLALTPEFDLSTVYNPPSRWQFGGRMLLIPKHVVSHEFEWETAVSSAFETTKWSFLRSSVGLYGWFEPLFELGGGLNFNRYEVELRFISQRGLLNSAYGGGFLLSQRLLF